MIKICINFFKNYKEKIFFIILHFSLLTAVGSLIVGNSIGLETRNLNVFFSPMPLVFDHKHFFSKVLLRLKYVDNEEEDIFVNKYIVDQIEGPDNRKLHFVRMLMFSKFYPEMWVRPNVKYFFCNESKLNFIKKKVQSVTIIINFKQSMQYLRVTCDGTN